MPEKIKTAFKIFLGILIIIFLLTLIIKETLYINAYFKCVETFGFNPRSSWLCISFLNGYPSSGGLP